MALAAFSTVVQVHGPAVLRYCRSLTDWHDAEDAWSETFLAALKAYPDLPQNANVEAWLITIARRKVIDRSRVRSRAAVPVAEIPERSLPEPHELHTLYSVLGALPEKQRKAVVYRHLGGLDYDQIAVMLDNSQAAARRAVADGLKTLRGTYQGELP